MSWWKNFLRGAFTPPESTEAIMEKIYQSKKAENLMSPHEALKTGKAELMNVPYRTIPITEEPKDPKPDLSTKPKDIIGYCFGFVCPKKHVVSTFDKITVDGYKNRRSCQKCGAVAKPATVRRLAEAQWVEDISDRLMYGSKYPYPVKFEWRNETYYPRYRVLWTKHEFVQFLDSPKTRKTARKK